MGQRDGRVAGCVAAAASPGVCSQPKRPHHACADCSPEELRLIRHLLAPERYNVNVRPVAHINETVTVAINLDINQLIDLVSSFSCVKRFSHWVARGHFLTSASKKLTLNPMVDFLTSAQKMTARHPCNVKTP